MFYHYLLQLLLINIYFNLTQLPAVHNLSNNRLSFRSSNHQLSIIEKSQNKSKEPILKIPCFYLIKN